MSELHWRFDFPVIFRCELADRTLLTGDFAVAYADQTERDYAALKAAAKNGKVKVYLE